jgi:hypothetical protein
MKSYKPVTTSTVGPVQYVQVEPNGHEQERPCRCIKEVRFSYDKKDRLKRIRYIYEEDTNAWGYVP